MDAFVIVGDQKSCKSSVIRSLTGCRIRGTRQFLIKGSVKMVFVQISSLQEGNQGISRVQFAREVKKSGATAVIFTLRTKAYGNHPDADAYLQYFRDIAGWRIVKVAALNTSSNPLSMSLPRKNVSIYPFTQKIPVINQLASQVRQQFQWV